MGTKKKSCCVSSYIAYIILFLVGLLVFSSDSYAVQIDSQWLKDGIVQIRTDLNFPTNIDSVPEAVFTDIVLEAQNYDNVYFKNPSRVFLYNGTPYITSTWNNNTAWDWTSTDNTSTIMYTLNFNSNGTYTNYGSTQNEAFPRIEQNRYRTPVDIYENSNLTTVKLQANMSYPLLNSITLSATSHNKYEFTTYNQCHVHLLGYAIYDFDFWIQAYDTESNSWSSSKELTEWSWAYTSDSSDSTNLYVYFGYINTLPVGTYRYVADYKGVNAFSVVSNSFNIGTDDINSSFTGNVDSNGNISGTTNNGNVIDNMKDFLTGEADVDSIDIDSDTIHNAINLPSTVNPYDNFLVVFLTGLSGALTAVTPPYLKFQVHDWRSYS